jgi:hypothetical protein
MNILEENQKSATAITATNPTNKNGPSFFNNSNNNANYSEEGNGNNVALSDSLFSFDFKTLVIIVLIIIMVLAYVKINLITIFGDAVQSGVDFISPLLTYLLDFIGDSSGKAINKAAEITADVSKGGIDLAEGAVQEVGNLLIGQAAVGTKKSYNMADPQPDSPEDNIQKPRSSLKTKWCLAGEYQNKRGCIAISESDKCMSGQLFPNEEMCMNPTLRR